MAEKIAALDAAKSDAMARRDMDAVRTLRALADEWRALEPVAAATRLRNELMAIAKHSQSQDWIEGLAAFAEKRKPKFTGR